MKLYDTQAKSYQTPTLPKHIQMYVCGITPYDSAHLGHIFTFMTYDLLTRRLIDAGHSVTHVRNITDVDEPIYVKAAELGVDYQDLAEQEIASFDQTLAALNLLPVNAAPKASEYVQQMADAVAALLVSKHAYRTNDDDIYFDTSKGADFGSFSGFNEKLLRGLFVSRGGSIEVPGKRNDLDFLLWKTITDSNDPAQWDTAIGVGRPGWHIECSVMSQSILGSEFDIHGGGSDLIFPHHECEIAQSLALHGTQPAKLWLQVSPMLLAGEKMSKSLGNLVFAKDLLQDYSGNVIKLALMHYHHRIGGEWQPELLQSAQSIMDGLAVATERASDDAAHELLHGIRAALDDDINTLEVIDALSQFIDKCTVNTQQTTSPEAQRMITSSYELLGLTV